MQFIPSVTVLWLLPLSNPIVEHVSPMSPLWTSPDLFVFELLKQYPEFYLCGGWVRDKLLGRSPADHDCVVSFETFSYLKHSIKQSAKYAASVLQMKVIHMKLDEINETEYFAGMVKLSLLISAYEDGKLIEHKLDLDIKSMFPNEGLEHESLYRDFTINCLFYDPWRNSFLGRLSDFDNLQHKMISPAIDFKTTMRDPSRLLRALRLRLRLGFSFSNSMFQGLLEVSVYQRFDRGFPRGNKSRTKSKCRQEYRKILMGLKPEKFLTALSTIFAIGLYSGLKPAVPFTHCGQFVEIFHQHAGESRRNLAAWAGWSKWKVPDKEYLQISVLVSIALVSMVKKMYSLQDNDFKEIFSTFICIRNGGSALKILQMLNQDISAKYRNKNADYACNQTHLMSFGSRFRGLHQ